MSISAYIRKLIDKEMKLDEQTSRALTGQVRQIAGGVDGSYGM